MTVCVCVEREGGVEGEGVKVGRVQAVTYSQFYLRCLHHYTYTSRIDGFQDCVSYLPGEPLLN